MRPIAAARNHQVEVLSARQYGEANAFVDACMRPETSLSMSADFPLLLAENAESLRLVIRAEGLIVAHAAGRWVDVSLKNAKPFELFNIGAVATDPAFRGQGMAKVLMEHLESSARNRGSRATILWSQEDAFYRRLGYVPAGRERLFVVERRSLPEPNGTLALAKNLSAMHTLRGSSNRLSRSVSDWEAQTQIPGCRFFTLCRNNELTAWLSMGKGLDYQGLVSEWAGDAHHLPALLACAMDHEGLEATAIFGPANDTSFRTVFGPLSRQEECQDLAFFKSLADENPQVVFGHEETEGECGGFYVWGLDSN